jgi:uncharacterized membrane protein
MTISLTRFLVVYAVTLPIFFAIDLVWLGLVAKEFYRKHLGYIMAPEVNWFAAILFYLIFIAGIVFFAVKPALEAQSATRALLFGALFGLVTYATYDLTNHATVRDWPPIVTVVDLAWGTTLSASVAWLSYLSVTRLLR